MQSYERAGLFRRGEFERLLPGKDVWVFDPVWEREAEVFSTRSPLIESPNLDLMVQSEAFGEEAEVLEIHDHQRALVWVNDRFYGILGPGLHALWTCFHRVRTELVSCSELRFSHAELDSILNHDDASCFFDTHLIPDGYVGLVYQSGRLIDQLVPGRYAFRYKAESLGLTLTTLGIKDIILPGEMKEILNKVTEAKKAAEASVITRREETAAMRSQLNTAKLMQENPTLMRLKELETLERIASGSKLSLLVGEKGLRESVLNVV